MAETAPAPQVYPQLAETTCWRALRIWVIIHVYQLLVPKSSVPRLPSYIYVCEGVTRMFSQQAILKKERLLFQKNIRGVWHALGAVCSRRLPLCRCERWALGSASFPQQWSSRSGSGSPHPAGAPARPGGTGGTGSGCK